MKIALRDFRAFQQTVPLAIRPLTFLVGENSSGKTSFLAALNYVWRLGERLGSPTFNDPPFDLGTFDEIVHRVRGRAKPSHFEIFLEEPVTADPDRYPFEMPSKKSSGRVTDIAHLRICFQNNVGDSRISLMELRFAEKYLVVEIGQSIQIQIQDLARKVIFSNAEFENNERSIFRTSKFDDFDVEQINYLIKHTILMKVRKSEEIEDEYRDLNLLGAALERLLRSFPNAIFASSPVRSNPIRVYTPTDQSRTPEGSHTPQRLFKIKESNIASWEKIKARLEDFGKSSGMFSAINVARYRSSGSSPFHINVTRGGKQSNIVDVGYGVSQALPILTDLIESPPSSGFLFQQPEVHLHPQAQAALGSFFVDYVIANKKSRIVAETHSDYLIDRVRLCVRRGVIEARDVSLIYFEAEGTSTQAFQLELDSQGNILHTPPGYRSFFLKEQMTMLGIDD